MSIITPSRNRKEFLEVAIASLEAQDYPRIEHIVIDGASTDGTVEMLMRHKSVLWRSEPDLGQSDALNKGLAIARGEIIGWLNSDDIYQAGAIRKAVDYLASHPDVDLVYGGCTLINEAGQRIGMHSTKEYDLAKLVYYDSGFFNVQALFFRPSVFKRVGGFDIELRYAMDYDWMIRIGKAGCKVAHITDVLGGFRLHQDAAQGRKHRALYRQEVMKVSRRYGGFVFSPIKFNIYYFLQQVPGGEATVPWLGRMKRALSLPKWL